MHAGATNARQRGFTLVECAVVCAVIAVLAGLAMPSFRRQELRAARLDAVQALNRLQLGQEQYRASTGLYAAQLATLRGVGSQSPRGRYSLALTLTGPDSYLATASARGVQLGDEGCTEITLEVAQGFAHAGPSAACWNR